MTTFKPGEQVEILSTGRCGSGWYPAEFVAAGLNDRLSVHLPDSPPGDLITVPREFVRRVANVPDIPAIHKRAWPLTVHGPLDFPAMAHNKALELDAARILYSPLSGPSARFDAERVLVALGWPELAIRLAKNEDIGPAGAS